MLLNGHIQYRAYSSIVQKFQTQNKSVYNGREFQDLNIPVPWGHLAARWWAPYEGRPILAVHGWQNNLGVFNRIIPLLEKNIGFLTWDLPGHGLSPREPAGTYCHHSSLLLSINYIKEYMKWDKFSFLGHSMGGMLTGEYTMMNPGTMDFTICVDGLKPIQITDSLKNAGRLLKMFPRINSFVTSTREPPSYTSQQVMAMTTRIHGRSIAADHAHHLLERAIKPSKIKPGKFYFTRDPRLTLGEIFTFPLDDQVKAARRVTTPFCVIKSTRGSYYEHKDNFHALLDALEENNRDFQYHIVEGTHHTILNNPERMVDIINDFIRKHYSGDTSLSGSSNTILDL